jgi:hypothetical protein
MLDALQTQLLATLTSTLTTHSPIDHSITSRDMWNLLLGLIDEVMERTSAPPKSVWLDWQFVPDSANSHSYEVDIVSAGTYILVAQTNCASVSVTINGQPVSIPFVAKVGEQITLAIRRAAPGSATVQLLSIETYRQLVVGTHQPC